MKSEFSRIQFRKRKTVSGDSKACTGCQTCAMICSLVHDGSIDPARSRIHVQADSFTGSFTPTVCQQCSDAPCYHACPEGAMEIEPLNGTVMILEGKCNGCGDCLPACPFQAIRLDQERKKALICDLCGGNPQCFQWCPTNALGITEFGGEIPK